MPRESVTCRSSSPCEAMFLYLQVRVPLVTVRKRSRTRNRFGAFRTTKCPRRAQFTVDLCRRSVEIVDVRVSHRGPERCRSARPSRYPRGTWEAELAAGCDANEDGLVRRAVVRFRPILQGRNRQVLSLDIGPTCSHGQIEQLQSTAEVPYSGIRGCSVILRPASPTTYAITP